MDWASVWTDIVLGLLIAGALATWVPDSFWRAFFFTNDPTIAKIEGPLVGPLVAIISFVCSIGNVPLAAVRWRGGVFFCGGGGFFFSQPLSPSPPFFFPQIYYFEGIFFFFFSF